MRHSHTIIHVTDVEQYDTSLHVVIQMEANKFFLVIIAVFFDPAFLFQRGCGSLGAFTDKTYFQADRPFCFEIS